MNLFCLLADAAAAWPGRTATKDGEDRQTYAQARTATECLAAHIAARGVVPGDRLACLLPNATGYLHTYFAAARLGAILMPLNTRLAATEQRAVIAHAAPRLLLTDGEHAAVAGELAGAFPAGVLRLDALPATTAPLPPLPTTAPATVAQLYYTSGTTGRPKGVMLTHGNVATHAHAAVAELDLAATDRWAHIAPMFHLADAWATFAITIAGGAHVFLRRFTPAHALDLLAHERITITNLVPTMLNLMVKEPDASARSYALRTMLSGGAPIAPAVVRQIVDVFRCEYVQTYGMTETSPYLTLSLLSDELRRLPPAEQMRLRCRTGRPFRGVTLKVVDDQGRPIAADGRAVGEIRVRGQTVTPGYWHDEASTRAAFDAEGFLCTGDLATLDHHGFVDIVDRKKDVIKTGGESVYSTEVENALYQHPAVLECAVFGIGDAVWGEIVATAVVLRPGRHATADELTAHCRAHIAGYKVPRRIRFCVALPKTGSGKIQKRALRDAAREDDSDDSAGGACGLRRDG